LATSNKRTTKSEAAATLVPPGPPVENGARATEKIPSYVLQLILSIQDALPPSQARVTQVILERPFEVLEWSAAQLGDAARASTATVVRTCRSLSFEGLDQLRLTLARDLGWPNPESPVVSSDANRVMQELFSQASEALPKMLRTVDPTTIEKVVEALTSAKTVLAVSSGGHSATLAAELAFGLSMVGVVATTCPDQVVQHVAARNLGPGDVCVAVSQSGSSRATIEAAAAAQEAGALVVAFGSQVRSHLDEVVDLSVCLDRIGYFMDPAAIINHVGLTLGIRALVLAVRARLGDRADQALRANLELVSSYHYRARRH
jgi:RpiR family transcriptional regulator, carbohydrate utilization regulator